MFSNGLICFSYIYRILLIRNKKLSRRSVCAVCVLLVLLSGVVGVRRSISVKLR